MRFDRLCRAPEFPQGLDWINTRGIPLRLFGDGGLVTGGAYILLEFWTSCCINCHHTIAEVRRLERRFPESLVVIGVHSAKFPAEHLTPHIREAASKLDVRHPIVNDNAFQIWRSYAVRAWPTLVLIDPEGYVIFSQSGEIDGAEFERALEPLIKEDFSQGAVSRAPAGGRHPADADVSRPLHFPTRLAVARSETLFVSDTGRHRILEIGIDDRARAGTVKRAWGNGGVGFRDCDAPLFHGPHGLAVAGQRLYVADTGNHAVRVIDLKSGRVHTVAGTGRIGRNHEAGAAPTETQLRSPWGLALVDSNVLMMAMAGSHQIWAMLNDDRLGPFAGTGAEALVDGPRNAASFNQPTDVVCGMGHLFVADSEASAIRAITLTESPEVITLVGQGLFEFGDRDGIGAEVRLQHPEGLACGDAVLYIADSYNHKVKRLDPVTGECRTLIGTGEAGSADGPFQSAELFDPEGLAVYGDRLFIVDTNNHRVRVACLSTNEIWTLEIRDESSAYST